MFGKQIDDTFGTEIAMKEVNSKHKTDEKNQTTMDEGRGHTGMDAGTGGLGAG